MSQSQAVQSVQADLKPKMLDLIEYLDESEQVAACAFFTNLLAVLLQAQEEEELLAFFIELSSTAFVGLYFDDVAAAKIDHILEYSMQIAETFSAPTGTSH